MDSILAAIIGAVLGGAISLGVYFLINRIRLINCSITKNELQASIPVVINNTNYRNVYLKTVLVKNKSGKDIKKINIIFRFDDDAVVIECHSNSKEGFDKQKINISKTEKNTAVAYIKNMNRSDKIEYTIRVANVTENTFSATECDIIGFKVKVKE